MGIDVSEVFVKQGFVFATLVFVAGIASSLAHEIGHCLFYWIQGIPAAFSITKEFPLRDITASEYAVGSLGGPLASLLLLGAAAFLFGKVRKDSRLRLPLSALMLANVLYFLMRALIAILKKRGGELEDVAGLFGLDYLAMVLVYIVICIAALYIWLKISAVRLSLRRVLSFVALLIGYTIFMMAVQTVDQNLFWEMHPTIQIDDGRTYNKYK